MDFGSLGGMGGAIGSFLASPDGQDAAKKFLASPQGYRNAEKFCSYSGRTESPHERCPGHIEGINLPPGVKEMILAALPK